jgi:hypothetical protein
MSDDQAKWAAWTTTRSEKTSAGSVPLEVVTHVPCPNYFLLPAETFGRVASKFGFVDLDFLVSIVASVSEWTDIMQKYPYNRVRVAGEDDDQVWIDGVFFDADRVIAAIQNRKALHFICVRFDDDGKEIHTSELAAAPAAAPAVRDRRSHLWYEIQTGQIKSNEFLRNLQFVWNDAAECKWIKVYWSYRFPPKGEMKEPERSALLAKMLQHLDDATTEEMVKRLKPLWEKHEPKTTPLTVYVRKETLRVEEDRIFAGQYCYVQTVVFGVNPFPSTSFAKSTDLLL